MWPPPEARPTFAVNGPPPRTRLDDGEYLGTQSEENELWPLTCS
jgi:hypothetical protein